MYNTLHYVRVAYSNVTVPTSPTNILLIKIWHISDENDRSSSIEPELFLHDRNDRTRSLSADSTRNESDKFNIYYEPQDFRRKLRPQSNSVQQIGGMFRSIFSFPIWLKSKKFSFCFFFLFWNFAFFIIFVFIFVLISFC